MIKIFAKHKTTEKVAVFCLREEIRFILIALEEKYGGSWLPVDETTKGEILHFDDGLEYLGFHGRDERYCKAIERL